MQGTYLLAVLILAAFILWPEEAAAVFTSVSLKIQIYFINLPAECTIRIYTVAGELVRKIEHSETVFNGAEAWDLLNLDNLEVAFGVYIYHIETDNAETVGKFAVIK